MSTRSAEHATFVIERTYPVSPARVFAAWADPAIKARWFGGTEDCGGGAGWKERSRECDFRVGGRERLVGGLPTGPIHTFDARYQDIVPDERIVYSYEMLADETRISVSLATVQLEPVGAGTRLTFTEQAVYLDAADQPADREKGSRLLLERLDAALQRVPATA